LLQCKKIIDHSLKEGQGKTEDGFFQLKDCSSGNKTGAELRKEDLVPKTGETGSVSANGPVSP
jgi:hypothetical protein